MSEPSKLSVYRLTALLVILVSLLTFVDGLIPQIQMILFGGQILISNAVVKVILLVCLPAGVVLHPRLRFANLPMNIWLVCAVYLLVEAGYLMAAAGVSAASVLFSYNSYYLLLLIGPALLAFRGSVPQRIIVRCIVWLFVACTIIAILQFVTGNPILYLESTDGSFYVNSWNFFEKVRAFSFFNSALEFGTFCAMCGALGVGISKKHPFQGFLLASVSAFGCYVTLTRLCILLFICSTTYALVLAYGKKESRGLWLPLLFFALGIATIFAGLNSLLGGDTSNLGDTGSLLARIEEWGYYLDVFINASITAKLFGLGLFQSGKIDAAMPFVIDSVPLALVLHIGLIGTALFGYLMLKMWLYLRREALATQQPLMIAAASLWSTLLCAGTFNIVFSSFGAVFVLAVLCKVGEDSPSVTAWKPRAIASAEMA